MSARVERRIGDLLANDLAKAMSAPAEVIEDVLVCALCDKEIFMDETPANYIGQVFHRECSLIYRIRRLETQVQGLLAREVV